MLTLAVVTMELNANTRALLDAAERANAAGQGAETERLLNEALHTDPDHPFVLSAVAMNLLGCGDAKQARELLERALLSETKSPALWLNFALTCRSLGDAIGELDALDKALALDPRFFLALLHKATTLERLGKPKQAAGVFQAFLACVPSQGISVPLQSAMAHARKAVQENNRSLERFLQSRLTEQLTAQTPKQRDRFIDCIDVMLGKKRVYTQQPTFMHFPRLPAIQFYDRDDFPWLDAVEAAADDIRNELLGVLAETKQDFVPYVSHPADAPLNQWQELNNSRRWGAFHLWREGEAVTENLARCPKTAAMLANAPQPVMQGHAPNAFFSLLDRETHIPPHTGVTNTRLVVHLPLVVPPRCGFRVGSEVREWQPGKAWVFDDTIEHEAWNRSTAPRAILIFDIWNPYLTQEERALVGAATEAIGEFYQGEAPYSSSL